MEKIKRFREVVKCSNPPEDKTVFWLPENSNEDPVLRFYSNGEWVKVLPSVEGNRVNWGNIEGEITNQRDLSTILNDCNEENPAADKNFVNSSIATSTATFRGTFDCRSGQTTGDTIINYTNAVGGYATETLISNSLQLLFVPTGVSVTNGKYYMDYTEDAGINIYVKYNDETIHVLATSLPGHTSVSCTLSNTGLGTSITLWAKVIPIGEVDNLVCCVTPQDASKIVDAIGDYLLGDDNYGFPWVQGWNCGGELVADANDYLFCILNSKYRRFKFSEGVFSFEYDLNNSSFTQAQWDAINSGINTTKVGLIDNIPIEKGTGTNSIIQRSLNNQAISSGAIALGSNNIAGVKGWYYKTVDFTNNKIYLSTTQVVPTSETGTTEAFTSGLVVGNKLSIVNNAKYDNSCTITAVDRNCITVNSLPFSTIASVTTLETDDYTISSIDNPTVGNVDLGEDAVCIGDSNKAAYAAFAMGRSNQAFGNYAYVEGRQNKGGYSTHVEGMLNTANGQYSHAEGYNNTTSGNYSHVEGNQNEAIATDAHAEGWQTKARGNYSHSEGYNSETGGTATSNDKTAGSEASFGVYAHVEGNSNIAKGTSSHAEGKTTFASGEASHAEGDHTKASGAATHSEGRNTVASGTYAHAEGSNTQSKGTASHTEGMYTVANNNYEHAEGKYNISNTNTIHSIGIGGGANNRRNAFEVLQNGSIYAYNIGEYDGTNPTSGTNDLKTVIDGKVNEPATDGTNGQVLTTDGNGGRTWTTVQGGGGGGSVSAVGLSMPTGFTVTGSPITTSGTFNVSLASGYTIPTTSTINGKENSSNKVTTITSSSTNTQYPSAKCVYDQIQVLDTKIGEILTAINSI